MNQQWQQPQYAQSTGAQAAQTQPMATQPQVAQPMPYAQNQNYPIPGFAQQQLGQTPGRLPLEQSYIENILRLNRGKVATVYMTFENNSEWNAKIFKGRIEAAGRDHIIIADLDTGMRYLLLMVNLDYITFDEPLEYQYPLGSQAPMAQYSPR